MKIKPIFLFSLPRSGSTFAQRVFAASPEISTLSEPWLLLPLLCALKREGTNAIYSHHHAVSGLEDFLADLPGGRENYLEAIRHCVTTLYSKASDRESKYFLDKTPRYHLIAEDIIETFPDSKFIFLWRNPLAIIGSMLDSGGCQWNLHAYKVDLYDGLTNLVATYEKYQSKVYAVRYEELVEGADTIWEAVYDYLNVPYENNFLQEFSKVRLNGRMGDSTGKFYCNEISKDSLDKWKGRLSNPVRKAWCRHYLKWIGKDRLGLMGYDLNQLLDELDELPSRIRFAASDIIHMSYGSLYCIFEFDILRKKIAALSERRHISPHT